MRGRSSRPPPQETTEGDTTTRVRAARGSAQERGRNSNQDCKILVNFWPASHFHMLKW